MRDNKEQSKCLNDSGSVYLEAVNFAEKEKGPRLFCDKNVVDTLKNKRMIRKISEELYEIVWTIGGCEAMGVASDKWSNVQKSIWEEMLPAAINLYKMHIGKGDIKVQYMELIKNVCRGIVKYAQDECNKADKAIEEILEMIKRQNVSCIYDAISDLTKKDILEGFLE